MELVRTKELLNAWNMALASTRGGGFRRASHCAVRNNQGPPTFLDVLYTSVIEMRSVRTLPIQDIEYLHHF